MGLLRNKVRKYVLSQIVIYEALPLFIILCGSIAFFLLHHNVEIHTPYRIEFFFTIVKGFLIMK